MSDLATPLTEDQAATAVPAEEFRMAASLDPDDFQAGGLWNDCDGVIRSIQYRVWDMNHKAPERIFVSGSVQQVDENGRPALDERDQPIIHEFNWSAGGEPDQWSISKDGYRLHPTGSKNQLTKGSNLQFVLDKMKAKGFSPKLALCDDKGGNLAGFLGLWAHWTRVPPPERKFSRRGEVNPNAGAAGAATGADTASQNSPSDLPIPSDIYNLTKDGRIGANPLTTGKTTPRARAASAPAASPTAAAATAGPVNGSAASSTAAAAPSPEVEAKAKAAVLDVLAQAKAKNRDTVPIAEFKTSCLRYLAKVPKVERAPILDLATSEAFMEAQGAVLTGDGEVLVA